MKKIYISKDDLVKVEEAVNGKPTVITVDSKKILKYLRGDAILLPTVRIVKT